MGASANALSLEVLGPTPQAAIRLLMRTFRNRGWRDDGSATQIVRLLETRHSISPQTAASQVSADFLAANDISRSTVQAALTELAERVNRTAIA